MKITFLDQSDSARNVTLEIGDRVNFALGFLTSDTGPLLEQINEESRIQFIDSNGVRWDGFEIHEI